MIKLANTFTLAFLVVNSSNTLAETQRKEVYKCTTTSVVGMKTNDSSRNYSSAPFRPDHTVKWLIERENPVKDSTYSKNRRMFALNDKKEYTGYSLVDTIIEGDRTLHSVYFAVNNYHNYTSSFVMDKHTGSFTLYGTTESGRQYDYPIAYIEAGLCQKWQS